MADDKVELKDINFRQLFPWTALFDGFRVALDPKKLLLAAGGILVMAIGWQILGWAFYSSRTEPAWASGEWERSQAGWDKFKTERNKWNLLHEAAGNVPTVYNPDDLAESIDEYDQIKQKFENVSTTQDEIATGKRPPVELTITSANGENKTVWVSAKPYGKMRTWPFFEDRGANPYLMVTGRADAWEKGRFWDWLVSKELPVLVEPLVKFLRPVVFLLHGKVGFWNYIYFLLVLLWTLATWAFFGGAITRMAAVQITRKEKISMVEALGFTRSHLLSYFSAPLIPLIGILIFCVLLMIFGLLHNLIPLVGDIVVDGLGWPLVLLAGLIMAIILVGLIGWPMMYATISTEGSDSFDALSRSYSYVLSNPWHYLWYSLVALAYGAVVVFFVGFMGSLMVNLGKWGVSLADIRSDRDPAYLCIYAPTSFGWRDLLLSGGNEVVTATGSPVHPDDWHWYNKVGAVMVAFWLDLVFLMVIGFGYSYFWSASTIIYLLMRRKVDDTEMDEVYVEEDEGEEAYSMPITTSPTTTAPSASPGTTPLSMVEPPASPSGTPSGGNPPP
jgi:hypothetical protein